MAQAFQRVGCIDKLASNYDPSATLSCDGCCRYKSSPKIIEGCTDKLASNFNSLATISCKGCCTYRWTEYQKPILTNTPVDVPAPQPYAVYDTSWNYTLNPLESNCVRDTGYEERGWITTDKGGSFYGNGYNLYIEQLNSYGTNAPNFGPNGTISDVVNAFNVLLTTKPNSRVYVNNTNLTPWIIPLYISDNPLTSNPFENKFRTDCETVGNGQSSVYIYQQDYPSFYGGTVQSSGYRYEDFYPGNINPGNNTFYIKHNLNDSNITANDIVISFYGSLETPLTKISDITPNLSLGGFRVSGPNEVQIQILNNSETIYSGDNYIKIVGNVEIKSRAFMACLCETSSVSDRCITRLYNPESPRIVQYQQITKKNAKCIKDFESYKTLLTNQYQLGWRGEKTTFFNDFMLSSLGIPLDDVQFILENALNTNQGLYPYGTNNIDIHTGQKRSSLILEKAFNNGANLWIPTATSTATDIINKKECCDIVGGIYKEGSYQPNPPNKDLKTTGVCLCNEIVKPCPTLNSGEIKILTETNEDSNGTITTTTWINVEERCCNNDSLQSTLNGNWVWESNNSINGGRCLLNQTTNNNACDDSTIITISETPINLKDINCLNDVITISAYIYFEEPNNKCTNGILLTDKSDKLTDEMLGLYRNPAETTSEISRFSKQTWSTSADNREIITKYSQSESGFGPSKLADELQGTLTPVPNDKNCCYDTETPIQGQLIIQDQNFNVINATSIGYVDTFSSTQTNINTNTNVGQGFNKWIRLTTTASTTDLSTITNVSSINVAVEFNDGLYKCCDYDIFFDDIEVGCLKAGVKTTYQVEPCVGYDLSSCVIDNKKSWVYNPGKDEMSDNVYDQIVRENGSNGMNIEQTGIIKAGGHGAINRVFAPSVDAELEFRDTDYFNFHGVIERHSKLVLNSKQLILQFNMCADDDCIINPAYLIGDDGEYILDDDGGRIVVGPYTPFPNLLELERFKKTFQGFWIQFIEQFIPATTIFVAGEKWCNNRICEEKIVADYLLDARRTDLSPAPVSDNITETPNTVDPNKSTQNTPVREQLNEPNETMTNGGEKGTTSDVTQPGPIVVGNYKLYSTKNIDPDWGDRVVYRSLA